MTNAQVVEARPDRVVVEVVIPGVDAHQVYAAVSDISRMREWSPEGRGRTATDGPLRAGDVFSGGNRRGARRWSTTCTVSRADDPGVFAFDVSWAGMPVARWGYEFEDTEGGVRVRESWAEGRQGAKGLFVKVAGLLASGVWDRSAHNAQTMQQTLDRLAASFGTSA